MKNAVYEILDDGSFYGEIRDCNGVWTNNSSLDECRNVLLEVLEEWIFIRKQ